MRQFALYCLCGGTGVATDLGLYLLLVYGGAWYQLANVLGYAGGTLVSFFLNRWITFGVRDNTARRLGIFFAVACVGYLVSSAMLWMLVESFRQSEGIAKIATLPVVVALQYTLNKTITFRMSNRESSSAMWNDR